METQPEKGWRQLDLFGERTARMEAARRSLDEFDLAQALYHYRVCLDRDPADPTAREAVEHLAFLSPRLAELEGEPGDPVSALLRIEGDLLESDRKGWHRRLAREAESRYGAGCEIAGTPVAMHWLAAGDLDRAFESLREALRSAPDSGRLIALLGDLHFLQDETPVARAYYLRSFLVDPSSIDLARLADPDVKKLVREAEDDYEAPGDGLDWAPALGTIKGLFQLPATTLPGLGEKPTDAPRDPEDPPGRAFYRQMLKERSARTLDEKLPHRKKLKSLFEPLFRKYMARFY